MTAIECPRCRGRAKIDDSGISVGQHKTPDGEVCGLHGSARVATGSSKKALRLEAELVIDRYVEAVKVKPLSPPKHSKKKAPKPRGPWVSVTSGGRGPGSGKRA